MEKIKEIDIFADDLFPAPYKPKEREYIVPLSERESIFEHEQPNTFCSSLIRRVIPGLISTEIVGVQPMAEPAGQVFAMRARYGEPIEPIEQPENVEQFYAPYIPLTMVRGIRPGTLNVFAATGGRQNGEMYYNVQDQQTYVWWNDDYIPIYDGLIE